MKRTRDLRDEDTAAASKQRRNNCSPAVDPFSEEFEVTASALADHPLDESSHIAGQVFMLWPMSNKTRKLQLRMLSDSLDVVFEGMGLEKFDFMSKDRLKVSLKGGRKDVKKAGSPHTLPFKLVFPNGALVQFLASEKRRDEKVVDLFQDAEETLRRNENNWFSPPSVVNEPSFRDERTVPLESDNSLIVPRVSEEVLFLDQDAHVADESRGASQGDKLSLELENHEPASTYIHRIGEQHAKALKPPMNTAVDFNPTISSLSRFTTSSPALAHSTAHLPKTKNKRVKKRDTRYARDSIRCGTSDNAQITGISGSNTQKLREKKAKEKLAEKTKAVQQRHKPSRPPTPCRDPALDLVAGFRSERGGLYTPLGEVVPGSSYSLVGVVADAGSIKRTKAGGLSKSYILVDPSRYGHQSLTINIFVSQSDELLLPSANPGQILLLRNIRFKDFYGKPQGTGYKDSFQWCGYAPVDGRHFYTITQSKLATFFTPSEAEMRYFVKLADWSRALNEANEVARNVMVDDASKGSVIYIPPGGTRHQKLQTISELEPGTFVDCVVELLRVWKDDVSSDIYVTDYTENKHLRHNVDVNDSLFGRRTLKISLWDGPNAMVDDLELHSFYLMKNVRVKKLEGSRIFLEGHLGYGDRLIYKLGSDSDQDNLQELLSRKQEYERDPQYSRFQSADDASNVAEPMLQEHTVPIAVPRVDVAQASRIITCSHMDQRRSTIEEIQRNTRCPNKFRVYARIIEYFPRRVEDFVIAECKVCGEILDDHHHNCPRCGDLTGKSTSFRYQFALRITDESRSELNINVSGYDASELLLGLDPRDARDDATELRSRLKPVLGHLDIRHNDFDEETETEDGPWLDMCLNSWVSAEDGELIRLYKLFGCKLHPQPQ